MRIKIFDDWKSIIHLTIGFFTPFFKPLLILFMYYQLIEYLYKRDNFIGDVVEYLLGISLYTLLSMVI